MYFLTVLNFSRYPNCSTITLFTFTCKEPQPVSYTHLDVYKRQTAHCALMSPIWRSDCLLNALTLIEDLLMASTLARIPSSTRHCKSWCNSTISACTWLAILDKCNIDMYYQQFTFATEQGMWWRMPFHCTHHCNICLLYTSRCV